MMHNMESTEHIEALQLEIAALKIERDYWKETSNTWHKMLNISVSNTQTAMGLLDYWRDEYHAISQKK